MGFDTTLPTPIFGVSTIPPVARPDGYCTKQVNWRNDPQEKLTVRPSFKSGLQGYSDRPAWPGPVYSSKDFVTYRDGQRLEVAVGADHIENKLYVMQRKGFAPFQEIKTITTDPKWFNGTEADLGVNDVDNLLFIWNKNKVMKSVVVNNQNPLKYTQAALFNVISALNYRESVYVQVKRNDVALITATWTVPGLTGSNTADADAKRATTRVAAELSSLCNAYTGDYSLRAQAFGSNVYVRPNGSVGTAWGNNDTLTLMVASGRGDDSIVVKNYQTGNISGLPKYCVPNVIRKIQPDPTSQSGVYYLRSAPLDGTTASVMTEVIWVEAFNPAEETSFEAGSNFYTLNVDTNTLEAFNLERRAIGDNISNPPRDFIGKRVEHIDMFQDRLLVLAGNKMNLSKTRDFKQFWRNSATSLLLTDPTDVGTSGNNSTLKHAVYHNKDLLVFAGDKQFKISGQQPITPQTAALPITTANECNLDVAPVLMGSYVYYAVNHGSSGGVRRFEIQVDTNMDTSVPISDHIIGMIPGRITLLVANPNQTMLIVRSNACKPNEFFVFEEQRWGESRIMSWCTWRLRDGVTINNIDIANETITVRYNTWEYMHCSLKGGRTWPETEVRMDELAVLLRGTDGMVEVPKSYDIEHPDFRLVLGTKYNGNTPLRNTLTQLDWVPAGERNGNWLLDVGGTENANVYAGYKYEAVYEPTRPYERDREGNVRTTDRLRVAHYFLELSNTYEIRRRIISEHWDIPDDEFTSRNAATQQYIDEVKPFTGQWRTSVDMNADDCTVEFINDSPYAATIASISYRAQQYSTKRRR